MTVFGKEMKHGFISLCVWTGAAAFMIIVCIAMFPQMKSQMEEVTDMFANMGDFTAAFGMDQVSFGEIMGFYAVECGNILGIGGGFFAALLGIMVLSKEEKDKTAEFLFTHPISRGKIITEKLLYVAIQILIFNAVIVLCSIVSCAVVGETIVWKSFLLLHLAFLIMQFELACICFGISTFLRRGGVGIGLGFAALMYFLNIISNISDRAEFLKYVTPFGYANASQIVADSSIEIKFLAIGIAVSIIFVVIGYVHYIKKDIR